MEGREKCEGEKTEGKEKKIAFPSLRLVQKMEHGRKEKS